MPFLKGTHHRGGGLELALHHHTGNGEAALELDTAPILQGHIIRDDKPVLTLPAYTLSLPLSQQELNKAYL